MKLKKIILMLTALALCGCASGEETEEATMTTLSELTAETEEVAVTTRPELTAETKMVALTFDDGPNTTTTMEVLDKLEKYGVVASFFLVGNNINEETAKSVERAYDLGYEIDNHSRTHSYMNEMTAEDIAAEIEYTNEKIVEITGTEPRFFRPPYIAISNLMYETIDMTFISGIGCNDWDDSVTAELRYQRIMRQVADGTIILLHDAEGNSLTVDALDLIIPDLLEQGYTFVTVTELFEAKQVEAQEYMVYSSVLQ